MLNNNIELSVIPDNKGGIKLKTGETYELLECFVSDAPSDIASINFLVRDASNQHFVLSENGDILTDRHSEIRFVGVRFDSKKGRAFDDTVFCEVKNVFDSKVTLCKTVLFSASTDDDHKFICYRVNNCNDPIEVTHWLKSSGWIALTKLKDDKKKMVMAFATKHQYDEWESNLSRHLIRITNSITKNVEAIDSVYDAPATVWSKLDDTGGVIAVYDHIL